MTADRKEALWHGVIVGLIGYASIALSVSIGDVMQGRSFFYTVSLLGEWLFYGLQDPAKVQVWAGPVFAYNGLHLVTLVGFGVLAGWLASVSERGPLFWYAALVLYLCVLAHMFGVVLFMTEPLRKEIPLLQILLPSVIGTGFMSAYLMWMHPQLRTEMSEWVDHTDDHEVVGPVAEVRRPL